MSKPYGSRDLSETFQTFLNGCAKVLFGVGAFVAVACVGLLVVNCFRVAGDASLSAEAIKNVDAFQKALFLGCIGASIGSTYLFWGEELLGAMQLFAAGALYFAPAYLPGLFGGTQNDAIAKALAAIQSGGSAMGLIGILVLFVDIIRRVRERAKVGVKADTLKYKGAKEDLDRQNVFLGKCWQLPYCRKYVRERCPIFHQKTTCWRERVGCMCEAEVIQTAMASKVIPKDSLLRDTPIPKNHRLTEPQKRERCQNCVIYNEHQRHKYRAALPITLASFVIVYGVFHGILIDLVHGVVSKIDSVLNVASLHSTTRVEAPTPFVEGLLFVLMLVALTYTLRLVEFMFFKIKI